ncbi:hypothetical protein HAP94_25895 [Acidithiobacillus ferrivorans]|nr:hypothetical protein [Acidithiobacillus ferrivorans]
MTNDPFYIIGRRAGVNPTALVANDLSATRLPAEDSLVGSNSSDNSPLRAVVWSAATFGAGVILGWLAKTRNANR